MGSKAKRADPELWDEVKAEVTRGEKGGRPGQWSAHKAQLAVQAYKGRGGRYIGPKRDDNSLAQWTEEDWGTRSGKRSRETGERYLPKDARRHLDSSDYERTTAKKRRDTAKGHQFSAQPPDIARKTARFRAPHQLDQPQGTKDDLYREAQRRNIAGRSRMSKDELAGALREDQT